MWRHVISSRHWFLFTKLYSVRCQETNRTVAVLHVAVLMASFSEETSVGNSQPLTVMRYAGVMPFVVKTQLCRIFIRIRNLSAFDTPACNTCTYLLSVGVKSVVDCIFLTFSIVCRGERFRNVEGMLDRNRNCKWTIKSNGPWSGCSVRSDVKCWRLLRWSGSFVVLCS